MKIQASTFQSARQHSVKLNSKKFNSQKTHSESLKKTSFSTYFHRLQEWLTTLSRDVFFTETDFGSWKGETELTNSQKAAILLDEKLQSSPRPPLTFIFSSFDDPDAIQLVKGLISLVSSYSGSEQSDVFVITSPVETIPLIYRGELAKLITEVQENFSALPNIPKIHITSFSPTGTLEERVEQLIKQKTSANTEANISSVFLEGDFPKAQPFVNEWMEKHSTDMLSMGFTEPPSIFAFDHHEDSAAAHRVDLVNSFCQSIFNSCSIAGPNGLFLNSLNAPSAFLGFLEVMAQTKIDLNKLQLFDGFLQNVSQATIGDVGFASFFCLTQEQSFLIPDKLGSYKVGFRNLFNLMVEYPFFMPFVGFTEKRCSINLRQRKGKEGSSSNVIPSLALPAKSLKRVPIVNANSNIPLRQNASSYIKEIIKMSKSDRLITAVAAIYYDFQCNKNKEALSQKDSEQYKEYKELAKQVILLDHNSFSNEYLTEIMDTFWKGLMKEIQIQVSKSPLMETYGLQNIHLSSKGTEFISVLLDLLSDNDDVKDLFGARLPVDNIRHILKKAVLNISGFKNNFIVTLPTEKDGSRTDYIVLMSGAVHNVSRATSLLNNVSEIGSVSPNPGGDAAGLYRSSRYSPQELLNQQNEKSN